jgi:hypothetical protein
MSEQVNFWEQHSVWFVLAAMAFPRLTLISTFGIVPFLWFSPLWFTAPRLSVGIAAGAMYSGTNPWLVCIALVWGVVGELLEKFALCKYLDGRKLRKAQRS